MPITNHETLLQHGQELAKSIGVEFRHGAKGEHLNVKKVEGVYQAVYTPESPLRPLIIAICVLLAMLPLTYFAFYFAVNRFAGE
jgi:hypothetical protein